MGRRDRTPALLLALVLLTSSGVAVAVTRTVPGTDIEIAAGGFVEGLGVIDTGGGPHQSPQATAALRIDAAVRRWAAHLELRGMAGGPFRSGEADVFNLRHMFQNASPALDFPEAYLTFREERLELRAGLQRFAFGKLDGIPPTDVVNPRDVHDPLLRDFEDAKIGVPSIFASYFPADWNAIDLSQIRLDLAYIPLTVPPRLPLTRERWFPPTIGDPGLGFPITLTTANDAPPVGFSTMGIMARAAGTWRAVDWDVYHYTGPETAPNATISAEVTSDLSQPQIPNAARAVLHQEHATIHMTGFDASTTLGSATLRAESAFFQNRHYLRPAIDLVNDVLGDSAASAAIIADLTAHQHATVPLGDLFVAADAVEWGVGIDYYLAGFLPLLQINQTVLLDHAPRLLIGRPDTRLTGVVRKAFWDDRFELDVRNAYAFETGSWLALPRLAYTVSDNLRVRLGYLVVGGSRNSLIGQYKRNDEVVLEARFSF